MSRPPTVAPVPRAAALVLVAISAGLHGLLFPPWSWVAVSWVALVPLFVALRGRGVLPAAALSGGWMFLTTGVVVAWLVPTLHHHFEWSLAASVGFLLAISALAAAPFVACAFGLAAAVPLPRGSAGRVFLLAAAWSAAEYARSHVGLRSPWAQLGDVHAASERLRQIADLTGVYGVSGVVALVNAAVAELVGLGLERRRGIAWPGRRAWLAPIAAASLLLLALGYGELRRHPPSVAGPALEVALVQGNVASELRWRRSGASRVLRRYGRLTRDATLADDDGSAPDLIVWPENAIQTGASDPIFGPPLLGLSRGGADLLVGAPRSERRGERRHHFNSALLLSGGEQVGFYDKRRLLPFSETRPLGSDLALETRGDLDTGDYTPGRKVGVFGVRGHALGVLICMEALYPDLARDAVAHGAVALVNLSNDSWYRGYGASEQHLAQAVFRAVETRRPLLRATTTGVTAFVTPEGRIESRLPELAAAVLRVRVPVHAGRVSLYSQVGDVFALGCLLACLAVPLARGVRQHVQTARDAESTPGAAAGAPRHAA